MKCVVDAMVLLCVRLQLKERLESEGASVALSPRAAEGEVAGVTGSLRRRCEESCVCEHRKRNKIENILPRAFFPKKAIHPSIHLGGHVSWCVPL